MNGSSAFIAVGGLLTAVLSGVAFSQTERAVPDEYSTIQAAIDAADAGDTILVAPGNYEERLSFRGKAITVDGVDGPSATTLDASGFDGPAITMDAFDGDGAALRGFTVTGGDGVNGGGLFLVGRGSIQNTTFVDNAADLGGAAFVAGEATFANCTFEANTARLGGAVYMAVSGATTIDAASFLENEAGSGGALYASPLSFGDGDVLVLNSRFERNAAEALGGAAVSLGRFLAATASEFSGNQSGGYGGAVFFGLGGEPVFDESTFLENAAASSGGAIYNGNASPTLVMGGDACGNAPQDFDGGVETENLNQLCAGFDSSDYDSIQDAVDDAEPGDTVYVAAGTYQGRLEFGGKSLDVRSLAGAESTVLDASGLDGPAVVMDAEGGEGARLYGFTIRGGSGVNGGGLFLVGSGTIESSRFIQNSADLGGAAFIAGQATFIDSTFELNSARLGGAIYTGLSGATSLQRTTFRDNQATSGGALYASPLSFGEGAIDIADSRFERNLATADGGAAVSLGRAFSARDSEFSENEAGTNGGGLCLALNGAVAIDQTNFFDNTAGEGGGAVFNGNDDPTTVADGSACGNLPEPFEGEVATTDVDTFCSGSGGPCPIDLAEPFGVLNGADVSAFISFFHAGSALADLTSDGTVNAEDVNAFITGWSTGCST